MPYSELITEAFCSVCTLQSALNQRKEKDLPTEFRELLTLLRCISCLQDIPQSAQITKGIEDSIQGLREVVGELRNTIQDVSASSSVSSLAEFSEDFGKINARCLSSVLLSLSFEKCTSNIAVAFFAH